MISIENVTLRDYQNNPIENEEYQEQKKKEKKHVITCRWYDVIDDWR